MKKKIKLDYSSIKIQSFITSVEEKLPVDLKAFATGHFTARQCNCGAR